MTSPIVGVVCMGIAVHGTILLWRGALDRDTADFGGLQPPELQAAIDRMHPPEAHPTQLMLLGVVLIIVGLGLAAIWSALAF